MAEKRTDKFVNMLVKSILTSSANTLTYDEISMGLSLFDKAALLIERLEYHITLASLDQMTADGDAIFGGLSTQDVLTSVGPSSNSTIHSFSLERHDFGTAAGGSFSLAPLIFDFSQLSGGGLLITPKPFFAFVNSVGLASVATMHIRIFFTIIKMQDADYFELLETRHYFGQ